MAVSEFKKWVSQNPRPPISVYLQIIKAKELGARYGLQVSLMVDEK